MISPKYVTVSTTKYAKICHCIHYLIHGTQNMSLYLIPGLEKIQWHRTVQSTHCAVHWADQAVALSFVETKGFWTFCGFRPCPVSRMGWQTHSAGYWGYGTRNVKFQTKKNVSPIWASFSQELWPIETQWVHKIHDQWPGGPDKQGLMHLMWAGHQ